MLAIKETEEKDSENERWGEGESANENTFTDFPFILFVIQFEHA